MKLPGGLHGQKSLRLPGREDFSALMKLKFIFN
jgi:hypothetical protein